ncbi:non-histone chromosomal protein HMG-14 isoform X2 [Myotis myotis]|uniref:non-histone chromosomal protein HMG-14 isoform X2 n=1 Tax=Myotis myotis TaxID=51298 RepID=UPI00174C67A2|nr:non-histone chromosomal protein HMG-14 isoform X2 [Myotis myotis]
MPKRKVSSAEGAAKEEKPAPAKAEAKPKKAAGKDKSADKKVQTKGKRGAKGKQAEVADQEPKEDLPAENGETKNEEVGTFVLLVFTLTVDNKLHFYVADKMVFIFYIKYFVA